MNNVEKFTQKERRQSHLPPRDNGQTRRHHEISDCPQPDEKSRECIMTIFVSYFASKAPNDRKICIAKKPYRFLPHLPKATAFAPSNPWADDWQSAYRADLDSRFPTPEALRDYLRILCETYPDPILCCYEKDPAQCHRSVLAAYVMEKLDIDLPEWKPEAGSETPPKPRAAKAKKVIAPVTALPLSLLSFL